MLIGSLDNRFLFLGMQLVFGDDVIEFMYIYIMLVSSINKGYIYNFVVILIKLFINGFSGILFYFYSDVYFVLDGMFFQNNF